MPPTTPPTTPPATPPPPGTAARAAPPRRGRTLLPRSLVARVYAVYSLSLVVIVGVALLLFYRFQFEVELENAQLGGDATIAMIAPLVSDSAVIGDYDTLRRTLERAVPDSSYTALTFIDLQGGRIDARPRDPPSVEAPHWLRRAVAGRLYDVNEPMTVGGVDYGVLRLSFASDRIAAGLWEQTRLTLIVAALGVLVGLALIRYALVRWLGPLSSVQAFERALAGESTGAVLPNGLDAPTEFQETFAVLGRAAASLQAQRAQAQATLSAITDAVFALDPDGRVVLANPAGQALADRQGMPVLGTPIDELLPGVLDDGPQDMASLTGQAGEGGGPLTPWPSRRLMLPPSRPGESERVIKSTLSVVRGADGGVAGYVLACHDITETHELTRRLSEELRQREGAMLGLRAALETLTRPDGARRPAGLDHPGTDVDDLSAISDMLSYMTRQLKARGDQLDAIFALSPDGFLSFDSRRRVNYVSPAFVKLTGLQEGEVFGQSEPVIEQRLASLQLHGERRWSGFEGMRRRQQAQDADLAPDDPRRGRSVRETIELHRSGRVVLEVGLQQGSGESVSQVLSLRDVTHETVVDQMKSEFLSMAAHELRTPMSSIYGFTELLMRRKPSPEKQAEILDTIHRQSLRMVTIINELLDLARIESRKGLDFNLVEADLVEAVPAWLGDFKPPFDRAPPRLECDLSQARVLMDRQKMEQALSNVVSNAYKYSPVEREVRVRVRTSDEAGSAARVNIEVIDQGLGLTPEQIARVGERFWRADASGSVPGTGLGMSIVKEILELHGGGVQLHSQPGIGTTVTLWLPRVD